MSASNVTLGLLHADVAAVMAEMLKPRTVEVFNAEGEKTGERVEYPTAPILAVAVKFLKDNSITADIENDKELSGLKEALERTRKARIPTDRDMKDALAEVGRGLLN